MAEKDAEKSTIKISLFLHQDHIRSFDECIKKEAKKESKEYNLKRSVGIEGKIYVHKPKEQSPDWFGLLNRLSHEPIETKKNASNKAIIVFKHKNRFFTLTYGYGKSMLNESTLVRNFGLIVAANLIDPKKIKSLNSMTIEDVIVDTQKQSTEFVTQDQFQTNRSGEIMKSLSGSPKSETIAKFVTGTDSLTATRQMNIEEIASDIDYYYSVFQQKDYQKNGFEWLDNVQRIKDSILKAKLEGKLVQAITQNEKVVIAPNKIIDWQEIKGFYLTGTRKKKPQNPSVLINYDEYFDYIRSKNLKNIIDKMKRDALYGINLDEVDIKISNIYDSVVFETMLDNRKYLLCYGDWYEINHQFYTQIKDRIRNVRTCSLSLPCCTRGEREDHYNSRIANGNNNFALMDQKNYQPKEYGYSKIEPCDIVTMQKQFIHIKKGGSSSKLSHLFAQGSVSSRILAKEYEFKTHINEVVESKFGPDFLKEEDRNHEYEIVFAIIDHRNGPIEEVLPFFSMVNLSQTLDNLESMKFNYSLALIKQEK